MAENFYAPSVSDATAALSPLQPQNMFAGATALSNLMAQQQQINNAIQSAKQSAGLYPGQLAQQQAALGQTEAGTAATQAGLITSAEANNYINTILDANSSFNNLDAGAKKVITDQVTKQFPPTGPDAKVSDVDSFVRTLITDLSMISQQKQAQQFQSRVDSVFTSRYGTGGKLIAAGQGIANTVAALNNGINGNLPISKANLDQAISVYNAAISAMGASSTSSAESYQSLEADVKSKVGYFAGFVPSALNKGMAEDLVVRMQALKQQLASQLQSLFASFDNDIGAQGIGAPAWQTKKSQYMAEFNGGPSVTTGANTIPGGASANPAAPLGGGNAPTSSGWSIVK
jgi:hypothetical protein